MDTAKHCQEQSAECRRLMQLASTEAEAQTLKNVSRSWMGLAGQIDRYNALMRDQRRVVQNKDASVGGPEVAVELPPSRPIAAVHETKAP